MSNNPFESPEVPDTIGLPPRRLGTTLLKIFLLVAIGFVLVALLLPGLQRRDVARRTQCKNNLKQIGLALHNYHDDYGAFPPAYTVDSEGRPLHSWRTLLLPYLEHSNLYQEIDFSKPWNDPVNAAVFEVSINEFQCPSLSIPKNHTTYLGVNGPDSFFNANAARIISEITDGTSNTLTVVEVPYDQSVPWMAPQDADEASILQLTEDSQLAHTGGYQGLIADGSVRFISVRLDQSTLRALLTISAGDVVGEF
ncbi:MAG: DUF1559 domain-containing protein [Planctomycetaceae bacterium]